jgi:hypothetical protein
MFQRASRQSRRRRRERLRAANANPGYLGGSEQKARQEAEEISKRDAALGKRAFDFIAQKK